MLTQTLFTYFTGSAVAPTAPWIRRLSRSSSPLFRLRLCRLQCCETGPHCAQGTAGGVVFGEAQGQPLGRGKRGDAFCLKEMNICMVCIYLCLPNLYLLCLSNVLCLIDLFLHLLIYPATCLSICLSLCLRLCLCRCLCNYMLVYAYVTSILYVYLECVNGFAASHVQLCVEMIGLPSSKTVNTQLKQSN